MTREQLQEKYPELFEDCFDFSISEGWMPMVETLVESIAGRADYLTKEASWLKGAIERNNYPEEREGYQKKLLEIVREQEALAQHPPRILQIKEKFGALRFYTRYTTPYISALITFCENLSYEVCEVCGKRATHVTTGWVTNRCEEHAKEYAERFNDERHGYKLKSKYAEQDHGDD